MLQQVCVHQGKRQRYFIMEHQNVPTFVKAIKECKSDDNGDYIDRTVKNG